MTAATEAHVRGDVPDGCVDPVVWYLVSCREGDTDEQDSSEVWALQRFAEAVAACDPRATPTGAQRLLEYLELV